jgi:hypothetical protein
MTLPDETVTELLARLMAVEQRLAVVEAAKDRHSTLLLAVQSEVKASGLVTDAKLDHLTELVELALKARELE